MRALAVAAAGGALLAAAVFAAAAIQWSSQSQITTSVLAPPVHFVLGSKANDDRYLSGASVSTNKTTFNTTVIGRIGADVTVKDVVRVTNEGASSQSVTLRAGQVSNVKVVAYTWTVKDGGTTVATLDMRSANPSATFDLPSGEHKIDLRIKLAKTASSGDTTYSAPMWMAIG